MLCFVRVLLLSTIDSNYQSVESIVEPCFHFSFYSEVVNS